MIPLIGPIIAGAGSLLGGAAGLIGGALGGIGNVAGSALGGLGQVAGWAVAHPTAVAEIAGTGFGIYQGIQGYDLQKEALDSQTKIAQMNAAVQADSAKAQAQLANSILSRQTAAGGGGVVAVPVSSAGGGLDMGTLLLIGAGLLLLSGRKKG